MKLGIYMLAFCVLYYISNNYGEKDECTSSEMTNEATDTSVEEIRRVAITFDDGPHRIYTEELLDGLRERNVVATFFVVGVNIEENKELLQRMKDEGHLIGNHTYSHVELSKLEPIKQEEEIVRTNQIIKDITGENVEYIRPPFGSYDRNKVKEGMLDGMFVTLWDIDPRDWCIMDKNQVVQNVVNNVEDGDIILLHDIFATSVEAALEIIDILQDRGYEFVTVDKLK